MKLIKVKDGLLERDNFYLTSSFDDFLAQNITHREDNKFFIDANTIIERDFYYTQFVVDINKENWEDINDVDMFQFYIETNLNKYGIVDTKMNGQSKYLKIIYYNQYIQCYSSNDNIIWQNIGGIQLKTGESIIKQGFNKSSDKSIQINSYNIYSSPYLIIENQPQNYKIELYDINNNLLSTNLFEDNKTCSIFLNCNTQGYIKLYDNENNLTYTSGTFDFQCGDVYDFTNYDLSIFYNNIDVTDEIVTFLQQYGSNYLYDVITIKNNSTTDTYNNLKISTTTYFDDIVQLSLDGETYTDSVVIEKLDPNSTIDIYINIKKGFTNGNFNARNFKLLIGKSIIEGLSMTLCDFNAEDKSNYIENNDITFDGTIHLAGNNKTYDYTLLNEYNLDEGIVETTDIIDKTSIPSIISIEDISDDTTQQIQITTASQESLLIQKEDYDFSAIYSINYFEIDGTNLDDKIKIVFSIDGGNLWLYYNGTTFVNIESLTAENVKIYGNTIMEFNKIKEKWNDIILNNKIRFAYLFGVESISNSESIDSLILNCNMEDDSL